MDSITSLENRIAKLEKQAFFFGRNKDKAYFRYKHIRTFLRKYMGDGVYFPNTTNLLLRPLGGTGVPTRVTKNEKLYVKKKEFARAIKNKEPIKIYSDNLDESWLLEWKTKGMFHSPFFNFEWNG